MHRREQIMQAVTAAVTGLPTTQHNVRRGRIYPIEGGVTEALSVYQGEDAPLPDEFQTWPNLDSELTLYVDAHVKTSAEQVESVLNAIAVEVTQALAAQDWWPAYVLDVVEAETAAPGLDGAGEKPVGNLRMGWTVTYRRTRTDPAN